MRICRASRGNSFGSCLFMMVLVIGGAVWAYFHFAHDYGIVNSGARDSIVVDDSENRVADLEYQRHMRERLLGVCDYTVGNTQQLLMRVRSGRFRTDPNAFEQRREEVLRDLRDNCEELNGRRVPPRFVPGHLKLGLAYRHSFEALQLVRQGFYEEPDVQGPHYKEADRLLRQARGESSEGRRLVQGQFR